jgi:hypothetical protein
MLNQNPFTQNFGHPHIIGWSILILLATPIIFGLEFIGTTLLQNRFVAQMGKFTRIVFGVVVVLLISLLCLMIWKWLEPHLGTW